MGIYLKILVFDELVEVYEVFIKVREKKNIREDLGWEGRIIEL